MTSVIQYKYIRVSNGNRIDWITIKEFLTSDLQPMRLGGSPEIITSVEELIIETLKREHPTEVLEKYFIGIIFLIKYGIEYLDVVLDSLGVDNG